MKKVVYITGGSKGIGFGIAEALIKEGYKVAISGRNLEQTEKAARQLGSPEIVLAVQSDVRYADQEQAAVAKILKQFGRLDIVVANAGLGIFADVRELSAEDFDLMIDTNLKGPFHTLKASVDQLIKNKGYFITIASLAGINFFAGGSGYNASKFGVVGFTQSVMLDLRASDVKVSTILPGSVTTNFNNHQPDDSKDFWKIAPEDIGEVVADLLKMNPRALPSKIEIRPAKTANMF